MALKSTRWSWIALKSGLKFEVWNLCGAGANYEGWNLRGAGPLAALKSGTDGSLRGAGTGDDGFLSTDQNIVEHQSFLSIVSRTTWEWAWNTTDQNNVGMRVEHQSSPKLRRTNKNKLLSKQNDN